MAEFLKEKWNELNDTKDYTRKYHFDDIQNNKTMAILAYLSFLVLIPLIAAKRSPYAKFHCRHGITLILVEFFSIMICDILANIPIIGWIFVVVGIVINLGCILLSVMGVLQVVHGKAKALPYIDTV